MNYRTHKLKPIFSDDIYHKNKKDKPCEMDLPLLKNDITTSEPNSKLKINSRYQHIRMNG